MLKVGSSLILLAGLLSSSGGASAQRSVTITDTTDGDSVTIAAPNGFSMSCNPSCSGAPTVSLSPNPAVRDLPVQVTVQNGLGDRLDWVGMAPQGSVNVCTGGPCTYWAYLSGNHIASPTGLKSASWTFPAPPVGVYDVHLFFHDSSTDEAPPVLLTVR